MTQRWEKHGLVFCPSGERDWLAGYAAVPFIDWIDEHRCYVFFSSRARDNRSHTGRLVLDLREPSRPVDVDLKPVVGPGEPGFFDADGAMGSDLVEVDGRRHLYYIGWNRAHEVAFRNAIGLAVSDDGIHYDKYSDGPVLDRSVSDPCFVASNCVRRVDRGFRMWYLSCKRWVRQPDGTYQHHYNIAVADSSDGITWVPSGATAIDFAHEGEYAISVPRVIARDGGFSMWYSYRSGPYGDTYRIGYAESADGEHWRRLDHLVDLPPSADGWDSDMVCYPYVFSYRGRLCMLYNGNGYGATGFGLAVLDE